MNGSSTLLAAGLLAGGLALAGHLVGEGIQEGTEPVRQVTVRGLAEREVRADVAEWPINLVASGDDLQAVSRRLEADLAALTAFLTEGGLPPGDVIRQRLTVSENQPYGQGPPPPRYTINQTVLVRSREVSVVEAISRRTAGLIAAGVVIQDYQGPQYVFTDLTAIKPEMIAEATRDARAAAERFAGDSGAEVGAILRASQGYFEITPLIQASQYASPGEQVDKKVRVVTTIDFELDD